MEVPTFHTQRLVLSGVTQEDIPSYQKHFSNYEVVRHLNAYVPWPYPSNGAEEHILQEILPHQGMDRWYWAIRLKALPKECVGAIGLLRDGKPENRGFWLTQDLWNEGIMTEALEPITDFAFNELHFQKLILSNAKGNIGSRRLKEKAGATLLEVIQNTFVDKRYRESEIWELTPDLWNNRHH